MASTSSSRPAQRKRSAPRKRSQEEHLDNVFHALSDRTRRALLARLERSPASITELAAPFAMSFAAVSKHLRVLEAAQLVRRAIDGRVHRCSIDPAPLRDVETWLAHYRVFWSDTLDALEAFAAAEPEQRR